jgi:hypothetical protein
MTREEKRCVGYYATSNRHGMQPALDVTVRRTLWIGKQRRRAGECPSGGVASGGGPCPWRDEGRSGSDERGEHDDLHSGGTICTVLVWGLFSFEEMECVFFVGQGLK